MLRLALLACLVSVGCKRKEPTNKNPPANHPPDPGTNPCAKAERRGPLMWIEDDYPLALACAKQKKVPLVVDLWAPWCHTCLSMQTTVFTDSSFAADADKFVFAALDTDREINADAVGKFPPSAWPTFYVIGNDEIVLARFIGAATVAQFHEFLDSAARALAGGGDAADARLLAAQRALTKRDYKTADEELTAALAAAPDAWLHRADALHAWIFARSKLGNPKACLDVAEKYLDTSGKNALSTNFVQTGLDCVDKLDKADAARGKAYRDKAIARLRAILGDKEAALSIDDRAEALGYLRDALDAAGKPDDAKKVAEESRALVDDAMAKAQAPLAKMTYLWPRAEVYVYLGRPLDLVPDYEKLASELPKEYDPPARLGWLYLKAKKLPEATTWTEKALAMVYGPRKARLLEQRADIAKAAGDTATERTYRERVVKLWESLPAGQQSPDKLDAAKRALAAGSGAGSGSASGKPASGKPAAKASASKPAGSGATK